MAISKVAYEFDPFEELGIKPPKSAADRREALDRIAELVKTNVLEYVGKGASPVSGGGWKKGLSPEYKKLKLKESGVGFSNMELTGDLLDALEVVKKRGNKLSLQIEGPEAPKADGHNNHSGDSKLPERLFIPREGMKFKRDIMSDMKRILEEYKETKE